MKKKYVVITGANSGIGFALSKIFREHGHSLLLLSRRTDNIKVLESPTVLCQSADVSDFNALKELFLVADEELGSVECVINNAGSLDAEELHLQDLPNWQKMINANLLGAANITKIVTAAMIEQQSGTIINIGSVAGKKTFPNLAMYCATKHGLHALSESVRQELAHQNIRVMTVAPGFTDTQLYDHISNAKIKTSLDDWARSLGKILSPEDVAKFIYSLYTLPQHINISDVCITPTKQI